MAGEAACSPLGEAGWQQGMDIATAIWSWLFIWNVVQTVKVTEQAIHGYARIPAFASPTRDTEL